MPKPKMAKAEVQSLSDMNERRPANTRRKSKEEMQADLEKLLQIMNVIDSKRT